MKRNGTSKEEWKISMSKLIEDGNFTTFLALLVTITVMKHNLTY